MTTIARELGDGGGTVAEDVGRAVRQEDHVARREPARLEPAHLEERSAPGDQVEHRARSLDELEAPRSPRLDATVDRVAQEAYAENVGEHIASRILDVDGSWTMGYVLRTSRHRRSNRSTHVRRMTDDVLSLLFTEARTHHAWSERPIDRATLERLYELVRMGPTAGNGQPIRVLFVESGEAKQRLKPALWAANVDKTMSAPVTAVLAFDAAFYEKMPELFPARPEMRDTIAALPPEVREGMARQSATLQGGYFIVAARALGLDAGPMGGFDAATIDQTFFEGSSWRAFLLVNLGHGRPEALFPRLPRLSFDTACRVE